MILWTGIDLVTECFGMRTLQEFEAVRTYNHSCFKCQLFGSVLLIEQKFRHMFFLNLSIFLSVKSICECLVLLMLCKCS